MIDNEKAILDATVSYKHKPGTSESLQKNPHTTNYDEGEDNESIQTIINPSNKEITSLLSRMSRKDKIIIASTLIFLATIVPITLIKYFSNENIDKIKEKSTQVIKINAKPPRQNEELKKAIYDGTSSEDVIIKQTEPLKEISKPVKVSDPVSVIEETVQKKINLINPDQEKINRLISDLENRNIPLLKIFGGKEVVDLLLKELQGIYNNYTSHEDVHAVLLQFLFKDKIRNVSAEDKKKIIRLIRLRDRLAAKDDFTIGQADLRLFN